jgi:hypothetical protein
LLDIGEDVSGVDFSKLVKEARDDDQWNLSKGKRFQAIENMFSLRHLVVNEVPLGRSFSDKGFISDFDEIYRMVRSAVWLMRVTDRIFGKYFFPRVGSRPYVEGAYIASEVKEIHVTRWAEMLKARSKSNYQKGVFKEAQKKWEAYARLFSDGISANYNSRLYL